MGIVKVRVKVGEEWNVKVSELGPPDSRIFTHHYSLTFHFHFHAPHFPPSLAAPHNGFSVPMNVHGTRNFFASSAARAFTPWTSVA